MREKAILYAPGLTSSRRIERLRFCLGVYTIREAITVAGVGLHVHPSVGMAVSGHVCRFCAVT